MDYSQTCSGSVAQTYSCVSLVERQTFSRLLDATEAISNVANKYEMDSLWNDCLMGVPIPYSAEEGYHNLFLCRSDLSIITRFPNTNPWRISQDLTTDNITMPLKPVIGETAAQKECTTMPKWRAETIIGSWPKCCVRGTWWCGYISKDGSFSFRCESSLKEAEL